MTSRAKQSNTEADEILHRCLSSTPPQSFLMIAGAGSGKTTSLIKGLNEILVRHGENLRLRRQKVACITYTDVAAKEIWADVGNNPLVHVSTIHSFFWSLVKPFQSDIHNWVTARIFEKLTDLQNAAANFSKRVQRRTREKNANEIIRYQQQQSRIKSVRLFNYGTGSDYLRGILGHDDIIKMGPQFIAENSLMRRLLAQQFPFLFVDESQDTSEDVVQAFRMVDTEFGEQFCIGFFGDPMQRIYMTGIGEIAPSDGWQTIRKKENFRCATSVLHVANAIRRDGDGLVQTRGRTEGPPEATVPVLGSAHVFILPADDRRDERITAVKGYMAAATGDGQWMLAPKSKSVKLLVIAHRMAAKREGFGELYSALNDKAPEKFKQGFLEGTLWPVVPFVRFVMPLVIALRDRNEFQAMQVLREQSPLLGRENIRDANVAELLSRLRGFVDTLLSMMESGSRATSKDVLLHIHRSGVFTLDPRMIAFLEDPVDVDESEESSGEGAAAVDQAEEDNEELTKELSAMDAFLSCTASQFSGYYNYLNKESPFSTQQGIKGAEFERVLVILDDDEGTHPQFSYDRYLGIQGLSERDLENQREGKETTVERTRRLFYVCCTRALKDLAVVLVTTSVEEAHKRIVALGHFTAESIHTAEDLERYLPSA